MQQHHRVYAIFFVFALSLGALLSRLPDLQTSLRLTEGQLGLMLISMSLGALVGLTFSSPLIARLGARTTAFATILVTSTMYALITFAPSALVAAPLLFVAGLFSGALEINVNTETDKREALLGKRIMNFAHGMWSLGFFVTALISAGLRQAGVSMQVHLLLILAAAAVASVLCFTKLETAAARVDAHGGKAPRIALPTRALATLCLIGSAPLLVEGAGIDWSAIYMRNIFDVAPFLGGLSVTLFTLFMAIARLTIDPVVDHYSPRLIAGTLLVVAIFGLIVVAIAPHPYVALLGFSLMGIGCSAVYPLAVSAAAQRTDRPASVNVAALGQVSFVVFFLGPPLLGFVAQYAGTRMSYWVCVPLVLAALLVIRALSPTQIRIIGEPEPIAPHG
ncbi:MAG: major facilitator superfamily 1 [Devosia sp.]|nr:major facilitator superfamily 1 [Devosia sp.]